MNLNDKVSVILTKDGANRLNELYDCKVHCEGETYSTQLWCLFDNFGNMINGFSTKLPFKDNEIKVL